MFVNSDFTELLNLFNVNKVKYLVIGEYAVVQYAEPRYTKDLDLWISADVTNAKAVYKALKKFGAPLSGLAEKDFAEEGYFYQMDIPPMRVDILMGIPGAKFSDQSQKGVRKTSRVCVRILGGGEIVGATACPCPLDGRPQGYAPTIQKRDAHPDLKI